MSRLNSSSSCWWLHTDRERRRRFGGTLSNSLCVVRGFGSNPTPHSCPLRLVVKEQSQNMPPYEVNEDREDDVSISWGLLCQ